MDTCSLLIVSDSTHGRTIFYVTKSIDLKIDKKYIFHSKIAVFFNFNFSKLASYSTYVAQLAIIGKRSFLNILVKKVF